VGAAFGILGSLVQDGVLLIPGFNSLTNASALSVVLTAVLARLAFGSTGLVGARPADAFGWRAYRPDAKHAWLPYQQAPRMAVTLGLFVGALTAWASVALLAAYPGVTGVLYTRPPHRAPAQASRTLLPGEAERLTLHGDRSSASGMATVAAARYSWCDQFSSRAWSASSAQQRPIVGVFNTRVASLEAALRPAGPPLMLSPLSRAMSWLSSWVARFRRGRGCRGDRVEADAEEGVLIGQRAYRDQISVAVTSEPALLEGRLDHRRRARRRHLL
jgi:hypothetical protein